MNTLNISLGFVGPGQWVIIAVIVLLLFGGRKIPELMRGLGGGIKEFKKATQEDEDEPKKKIDDDKK
ncbi:Sec-independent protein translocase subunit TatA/TatB [Wenyingzhuangia aestuarii]|uniref:Sec-independent protein translocase subunit TatA/TatB n=1 Tax=Wenyingzhuangia aestuarii TaxID=1647582 RepID=UPI00143C11CB|nr:twin-arginine translocase TatA/TatE family subunit [Wenyingzhuangia aestuarii]NJB81260.1 sec-independent protein translocase protein TatA [Wenyingzhuangia aestuarii]